MDSGSQTLHDRLAQTERSYVTEAVIRIPVNVAGHGTRGVGDWALKGFKLLDILLPPELFDQATGPTARAIAAYGEDRLKPEPGLYTIDRQGSLTKQSPQPRHCLPARSPTWCCCTAPFLRRAPAWPALPFS